LGQQITKLSRQVSLDQVYFIIFDDLKEKLDQVYRGVIEILKLPAHSLDSYQVYNQKKERSFYWLAFFLKVVNKAKKKLNIRKGVGLANLINRKNKKKSSGKHTKEFKEMRPMLIKAFRGDVCKIEKITNKQLNNWKEI